MVYINCFYKSKDSVYYIADRCKRLHTPCYGMYIAYNCRYNETANVNSLFHLEYIPYGKPVLLTESLLASAENLNDCCLDCIYCYDSETKSRLDINRDDKNIRLYCDLRLGCAQETIGEMFPNCKYSCARQPSREAITKTHVGFKGMFRQIAESNERFEIPINCSFLSPNAFEALVSRMDANDVIYFGSGRSLIDNGKSEYAQTADEYLAHHGEDIDCVCIRAQDASKELYCGFLRNDRADDHRVVCVPSLATAVFSDDESVGVAPYNWGYGHTLFAPKEIVEMLNLIEQNEMNGVAKTRLCDAWNTDDLDVIHAPTEAEAR